MRQRATVGSLLPDGSVSLLVQRVSACTGDCGHCGGCGAVGQSVQVTARAPFPVEPGERVWVESRSGAVLGAAALVVLLLLCLIPLAKLGIMMAAYYLLAAVLQPISDERITGCLAGVGCGMKLLFQTICMVLVLFLLTVALTTAMTGR